MIYQGVRRCDTCSSEILGRGGRDICYLCRLLIDEDSVAVADENLPFATSNILLFPQKRVKRSPIAP